MNCANSITPPKQTCFKGYGKIDVKIYHKFNHELIDLVCDRTIQNNTDFATTFAEVLEKNVEKIKKVFAQPIQKIEESFNDAKLAGLSKESLEDTYRNIISTFRKDFCNEQTEDIEKLAPKMITIKPGREFIQDDIEANIINDYGSKGLKSLTGHSINLKNVVNKDLRIYANYRAGIENCKIKSINSNNKVYAKNSEVTEGISCFNEIVATNLKTHKIDAGSAQINGENNFINYINILDGFTSNGALISDTIESQRGFVSINETAQGLKNYVKNIIALKNIRMNNNFGTKAISQEGKILGENNHIDTISAKDYILLKNIFAKSIQSETKIDIMGEQNQVTEFIKAPEINAENLTVEKLIFEKPFVAVRGVTIRQGTEYFSSKAEDLRKKLNAKIQVIRTCLKSPELSDKKFAFMDNSKFIDRYYDLNFTQDLKNNKNFSKENLEDIIEDSKFNFDDRRKLALPSPYQRN